MEKRLKKLVGMWGLGYRQYIRGAALMHALNAHEAEGANHPRYVGVELPARTKVIPNGIDPSMLEYQPDRSAVDTLAPGLNGAPYILYLARLHPGKGCDLLGDAFIEVAREIPDVHLLMVGQDQGGRSLMEPAIREAHLSARVHYVGAVYDDRKYALYQGASVYCLPAVMKGSACRLPRL